MSNDPKEPEMTDEMRQKVDDIINAIKIDDPQAIGNFERKIREVVDKAPDWRTILMDMGVSDSSIKSPLERKETHQRFLLAMQEEMRTYSSLLQPYVLAGKFIVHNLHALPSTKQLPVDKRMQLFENIHTLKNLHDDIYVSLRLMEISLSDSFNQLNDPLLEALSPEQAKEMKKDLENRASRSVDPILKKGL